MSDLKEENFCVNRSDDVKQKQGLSRGNKGWGFPILWLSACLPACLSSHSR